MTGLLLALALGGRAWSGEPAAGQAAVAASSASVAVSTPAAAAPPVAAFHKPAAAPAVKTRIIVHKEAADWEPISVRLRPASGGRTFFEDQVRKVRGRYAGQSSAAKAAARVHSAGSDRWLVISIYPVSLRPHRMHLEARFFIQEGYLEGVRIVSVSVLGGSYSASDDQEDSFTLRAKGMDFVEQSPGSAEVELAAVDPGPGPHVRNAGRVRNAAFGGKELGFVNFSWSMTGVSGEKAATTKQAR